MKQKEQPQYSRHRHRNWTLISPSPKRSSHSTIRYSCEASTDTRSLGHPLTAPAAGPPRPPRSGPGASRSALAGAARGRPAFPGAGPRVAGAPHGASRWRRLGRRPVPVAGPVGVARGRRHLGDVLGRVPCRAELQPHLQAPQPQAPQPQAPQPQPQAQQPQPQAQQPQAAEPDSQLCASQASRSPTPRPAE